MQRLRLRTHMSFEGQFFTTWLLQEGEAYALVEEATGGEPLPLPATAIEPVFDRYARPLDVPVPALTGDDACIDVALATGELGFLRAFSYRGPVDVIENDYLVLERPARETLCGPAALISQALGALARAAARR